VQSHLITQELAASGQSATAAQTPLVNGATRLRPDLWTRLATLKDADGYSCAEVLVACAEVELVHAGNEFSQIGWRHAKPYVQIAEDRVQEAASASGRCAAEAQIARAPAAPPRAEPAAALAAAPTTAPRTREVSLAADALFRFDRRSPEDLLPDGKARLDELAVELGRDYARIERIRLVGHTDRLGKPAYNERLSLDRANTVRRYLESRGVTGPFETSGVGSAGAATECHGKPRSAALHDCLQSDRRVDIAIVGVPREPGHDSR
jgi:outer membrane protein OmpA-like peptidoglycan-associated protein